MSFAYRGEKIFNVQDPKYTECGPPEVKRSDHRLKRFYSNSDKRAWDYCEVTRYKHFYEIITGSKVGSRIQCVKNYNPSSLTLSSSSLTFFCLPGMTWEMGRERKCRASRVLLTNVMTSFFVPRRNARAQTIPLEWRSTISRSLTADLYPFPFWFWSPFRMPSALGSPGQGVARGEGETW